MKSECLEIGEMVPISGSGWRDWVMGFDWRDGRGVEEAL